MRLVSFVLFLKNHHQRRRSLLNIVLVERVHVKIICRVASIEISIAASHTTVIVGRLLTAAAVKTTIGSSITTLELFETTGCQNARAQEGDP